ncbi:ATP-binding protein, partial [Streptomyces longwoodensis]
GRRADARRGRPGPAAGGAKELAQIGPLILELLPGPHELSDDEAEAVTATAALVGTEAAVPVLAQYRNHSAQRVRLNLMRAWNFFDAEVYADEVLSHVDTHDLFLFAASPAQVRALPRLGDRTRLGVTGDHDPAEILKALPERVEYLGLYENALLNDLQPFGSMSCVRHINLVRCPGVEDLTPLTEAGLTSLFIRDLGGTAGLGLLSTLQSLTASTSLPGGLSTLPQDASLTLLSLGGDAVAETGLRGLSTWPTLESLYIQEDIGDLTPRDWAEIATLPRLSSMSIAAKYLPGLLSAPHLPSLKAVYVTSVHEDTGLTPLSGSCPQVRTVGLYLEHSTGLVTAPYQALFPEAKVTLYPARPLLL